MRARACLCVNSSPHALQVVILSVPQYLVCSGSCWRPTCPPLRAYAGALVGSTLLVFKNSVKLIW